LPLVCVRSVSRRGRTQALGGGSIEPYANDAPLAYEGQFDRLTNVSGERGVDVLGGHLAYVTPIDQQDLVSDLDPGSLGGQPRRNLAYEQAFIAVLQQGSADGSPAGAARQGEDEKR
jgi:hypothetical protein